MQKNTFTSISWSFSFGCKIFKTWYNSIYCS